MSWPATQPGGISSLKLILGLKSLKFWLSVGGSLRNAVARGRGGRGRRGREEEEEGEGSPRECKLLAESQHTVGPRGQPNR
jgi:hypothetical protein